MARLWPIIIVILVILPVRCRGAERALPGARQEVMFTLKDGSRICGVVLAYKDGIYRVKTRYLGILQVPYITISKLVFDPQHAPPQSAGPRLRSRKQLTPLSRAPAQELKPKDPTPEERYKMAVAHARRERRAGKTTQVKMPKGLASMFGLGEFTESMMSGEMQDRMLDLAENDPNQELYVRYERQ